MDTWRRRNYFIDRPFQAKFTLTFFAIVIASSLAIGVLLFFLLNNFTTVAIENAHVTVKRTSDFILPIVVSTLVGVTLISALAVIALTILMSHRIAGPLYRLAKDIALFKEGDLSVDFRTRHTDQMKELAGALADMGDTMRDKHKKLKDASAALKQSLEDPGEDKRAALVRYRALEEVINHFKV